MCAPRCKMEVEVIGDECRVCVCARACVSRLFTSIDLPVETCAYLHYLAHVCAPRISLTVLILRDACVWWWTQFGE